VQQVDTPDVKATGPKQADPGFGAATATPVESAQAVASAQSGASIASSKNFAGDFNGGSLGSVQPRLYGAPSWGGGGSGNAPPQGFVPVNWLNAEVFVIPRRWANNWFSAVSGIGESLLCFAAFFFFHPSIHTLELTTLFRPPPPHHPSHLSRTPQARASSSTSSTLTGRPS
jgi:hypothetical protein